MRQAGFSMVELIVVMIIVGILAVAALPRFGDRTTYDSRSFHDETLGALRYAQKTAIASRRNVCATFTTTSITLQTANAAGSGVSCTTTALAGPTGVQPYAITARGSAAYSSTLVNFWFDAEGRPIRASDSASFSPTIQVSGVTGGITVEQETGYVH
jgi:MSHA pilin protein MshC